ncbi:crotonase/enoyl-CoA hydratase family protein [Luteipulveratus flavus]|uniref:Crotonase/enoyl-CoA hydratase family protein n=1 Tax=Luteipulveratus flavus TaxID=3031728 RepID=A0ABT6CAS1_9MICO|nr:crotonase/enoyl-CoA hydratase family protein [Luteipulveratus sp. YIM 133296]MDF8265472.1 crotonase/enoyl-CoA hydratase family protein [Luteipulveratus sp. YIM 133296]
MPYLSASLEDGVAHVRLNRPDKLNALTLPALDELATMARHLRRDRSLRAAVLSGEGRSFCAGLDFASVFGDGPVQVARRFVPRPWLGTNPFQEACWAWRRLPVPVIAVVHGHCYGGGLQIALAADFRFTTADAQWSVLEGRWGLIPDMSGVRSLAQQVGIDTAKRLTMTAEVVSGEEAVRLGLATATSEDPYADARALAAQIATRSPDAVAAAKRLFDRRWSSSPRRTFARERLEQAVLLGAPNTAIMRKASADRSAEGEPPRFRRRLLP